MARVVKEYVVRRGEILDTAQRLIYTKGYEQMTIQDILDALDISKGAFYHYFDSKQALLAALIDRIVEEAENLLTPILADQQLNALQKFQVYFDTAVRWKAAQKDLMLALLRVWYIDDNAIVRQKVTSASLQRLGPMLTKIILEGNREGSLNTPFPEQAASILMGIIMGLSESMAGFLLSQGDKDLESIRAIVEAYSDAMARVIGAPPGALRLVDADKLEEWAV